MRPSRFSCKLYHQIGRQAIRILFVNQVITVPNIGPFMFICIDSSLFMNRVFFFWNVVCNVRHGARSFRRHFARSITIRKKRVVCSQNGTVFRVLPKEAKKSDNHRACNPNPPGLELINVDCETRIRRTGIPTRRSAFVD